MAQEMSLCRLLTRSAQHLALICGDKVYDLTSTKRPQFRSLAAWLQSASGRVPRAIEELERVPETSAPLCSLAQLFDATRSPRLLKPVDTQETWACGVTYEMSREARMRESQEPTIYGKVYDAPRPEIFFKATPNLVVGPGEAVGIRRDSRWDVPEPELALVITPNLEIVGLTIGNDMSSRDIEGQNPLYLPQAKIYDRCCALGPMIRLITGIDPLSLGVHLTIFRNGEPLFRGETNTSRIHRPLAELVACLGHSTHFTEGAFVLTGTGIVPPDTMTLAEGDVVEITIDGIGTLSNPVVRV